MKRLDSRFHGNDKIVHISTSKELKGYIIVQSLKTSSPLMGEGWGEGDKQSRYNQLFPLPLVPSLQGRGKRNAPFLSIIMPTCRHSGAFYECIKFKKKNYLPIIVSCVTDATD